MTAPTLLPSRTLDVHTGILLAAHYLSDTRREVDRVVDALVAAGERNIEIKIYDGFTVTQFGNGKDANQTRRLQLAHVTWGWLTEDKGAVTVSLYLDAGIVSADREV